MTPQLQIKGLPPPKAVILDFDGVIVNSHTAHKKAWERVNKIPAPGGTSEQKNLKNKILIESFLPLPYADGAKDFIRQLENMGLKWGIASNGNRSYVHMDMTIKSLCPHFLVTKDDTRLGKPSPEPLLRCAQGMGIPVDQYRDIWVFDDRASGIIAAKKAGMIAIGVEASKDRGDLTNSMPDVVITSLQELCHKTQMTRSRSPKKTGIARTI